MSRLGTIHSWCRLTAVFAVVAGLTLMLAGCATTEDSDIPWNTPQPWEGHPSIPGLTPE